RFAYNAQHMQPNLLTSTGAWLFRGSTPNPHQPEVLPSSSAARLSALENSELEVSKIVLYVIMSSLAQPTPAQPTPAQPSLAQPSPAQPDLVPWGIGSKAKCFPVAVPCRSQTGNSPSRNRRSNGNNRGSSGKSNSMSASSGKGNNMSLLVNVQVTMADKSNTGKKRLEELKRECIIQKEQSKPTPAQRCPFPPCLTLPHPLPALPHPLPALPHPLSARPHPLSALPHPLPALRCPSPPCPALPHPLPALRCPSQPGPALPHPLPALPHPLSALRCMCRSTMSEIASSVLRGRTTVSGAPIRPGIDTPAPRTGRRRHDQSPPRAQTPTQRTTKQKSDEHQPEQEQEEQREQQREQRQEQQHERQQRQGQQHELAGECAAAAGCRCVAVQFCFSSQSPSVQSEPL
ncbi:hypothetical protein QJQ45_026658, partial [Haematococcus lacustris]